MGIARAAQFIRKCALNYQRDCHVLKLDIMSFFIRINRRILWERLRCFIETHYNQADKALVLEIACKVIQMSQHHRRAGIEPLISHTKHGGQLGRSRMQSDKTTKSAGYATVFGFNLRQLTRCLAGEARPKVDVVNNITANNANIIEKMSIQLT